MQPPGVARWKNRLQASGRHRLLAGWCAPMAYGSRGVVELGCEYARKSEDNFGAIRLEAEKDRKRARPQERRVGSVPGHRKQRTAIARHPMGRPVRQAIESCSTEDRLC